MYWYVVYNNNLLSRLYYLGSITVEFRDAYCGNQAEMLE